MPRIRVLIGRGASYEPRSRSAVLFLVALSSAAIMNAKRPQAQHVGAHPHPHDREDYPRIDVRYQRHRDGEGNPQEDHRRCLYPSLDGTMIKIVADVRPQNPIAEEPTVEAFRTSEVTVGGEQQEGVVGRSGTATPITPITRAIDPKMIRKYSFMGLFMSITWRSGPARRIRFPPSRRIPPSRGSGRGRTRGAPSSR